MRIEDLSCKTVGDRRRIEALVVYEDIDLPSLRLFFEAGPPLADALEASPEAFVIPAFPMAAWMGERRIKVEGALDATLAAGLRQAGSLLAAWFDNCGTVELEADKGFRTLRPGSQPRAVALCGAGVDALAMLRENRQLYPLDHPHSIRTAVYSFGHGPFDLPDGKEDPHMRAWSEAQTRRLEALGERIGFTLCRLDTNAPRLDPRSRRSFYDVGNSAGYLAALVASPGYVTDALIASAGDGPVPGAHGSHPMLDVHYSTSAVRVHHLQPQLTRNEKVGMIADWEPAFDTLQVCFEGPDLPADKPNCGTCEKCVRTMTGLVSWNALPRFTAFEQDDVTPEMIEAIWIRHANVYITRPDLLARLESVGRHDLVRAIQAQIKRKKETLWARRRRKYRESITKRLGFLKDRTTRSMRGQA